MGATVIVGAAGVAEHAQADAEVHRVLHRCTGVAAQMRARDLNGDEALKPFKFAIGREIDLGNGAKALVNYGNPQPYTGESDPGEGSGTASTTGSTQGGGSGTAW
jgi:hypothetical protein